MKKRKILILLTVFFFALGFVSRLNQARAEDSFIETHRENISDGQPDLSEWVHGEIKGGEVTENGVIPQIEETMATQLIGISTEEGGVVGGGVMQGVTEMIASTYRNPPASGVYYAYDVLHRLGAAPAYAANGIGFSGLQPILPLWKAFRNVAYTVFAIGMLVVGLMIMFRVKISPQAVLTLENALPRMIGVLVLITFSYAIAGFMIDLMYVVMALSISILSSEGINSSSIIWRGATPTNVIHSGFWALIPAMGIGFKGAFALGGSISYMVTSFGNFIPVVSQATGGAGFLVGGVLFALIWIIIALVLLIKLLINLIKCYIGIITAVIFSPIIIATGIMPGKNAFGGWLKGLAANLLAFPGVLIGMMIAAYVVGDTFKGGAMWYPPLMGPPEAEALSWGAGNISKVFTKSIIGMGFLFVLPNIPNIIKKAMGIEDSGIGGIVAGIVPAPLRWMGEGGQKAVAGLGEKAASAAGTYVSERPLYQAGKKLIRRPRQAEGTPLAPGQGPPRRT